MSAAKAEQSVVIPFGFGLSYTNFFYSNISISASRIRACDVVQAISTYVVHGSTPTFFVPIQRLLSMFRRCGHCTPVFITS